MSIKYGNFEMPSVIKVEENPEDSNLVRFIAEPFEKGFGHTVGNSLRRVLLSSIEAPAIVSIKIEGASHEYMAMDGIIEDVTNIVLNFKGALLRRLSESSHDSPRSIHHHTVELDITAEMIDKANGSYLVTLEQIAGDGKYEVVNKDHVLFTVTKPMTKRIDLKIQNGRGYVASERHEVENKVAYEIVIDSIFSPVRLVNYFIKNTRVGQDTDFDQLILDVQTDGRVTPQEALNFAAQIIGEHLRVFAELKTQKVVFESNEAKTQTDRDLILQKLALKVGEIELSVRSTNCLSGAGIETIGELVLMPEVDLLKFRNFGRKSLTEIKQKLHDMSLSLGMDLSRYGITHENVKELVDEYLENRGTTHETS